MSQADQLLRERSHPIDVSAAPPKVHPHVAAVGPTQARKRLSERGELKLRHGIVFVAARSTPMRRMRFGCCARAASGQTAAPPRNLMNSRRLMPSMASSEADLIILI